MTSFQLKKYIKLRCSPGREISKPVRKMRKTPFPNLIPAYATTLFDTIGHEIERLSVSHMSPPLTPPHRALRGFN